MASDRSQGGPGPSARSTGPLPERERRRAPTDPRSGSEAGGRSLAPTPAPPRLAAAFVHAPRDGFPALTPLRRELVEAVEAALPADFLARAPFCRIALWLHADGAAGPARLAVRVAPLPDGDWLDVELPVPAGAVAARNPVQRRACLEAALLGALIVVGRRFGLPVRGLRRIRYRRLASVPFRRRR